MRSSLCSRAVVLINSKRLITLALTKGNLSLDNSLPSCPVHTRLCVLRREYRCSSPMPCAHSQRSHSAQTHALASLSCPVHTRLCVLRREYSSGQNFSPDPARSLFSAHPPVPCELVELAASVWTWCKGLICRLLGHRALGSTWSCCGGVGSGCGLAPSPRPGAL